MIKRIYERREARFLLPAMLAGMSLGACSVSATSPVSTVNGTPTSTNEVARQLSGDEMWSGSSSVSRGGITSNIALENGV